MRIALLVIIPLIGLILGWIIRWLYARFQLSSSEQKAERVIQEALKEAEAKKKEALLEAKDKIIRERNQLERETRERRVELQRLERRLMQKEENLEKRLESVENQERSVVNRERGLLDREKELDLEQEKWTKELERISGLTVAEAKKLLIQSLENEAMHEAQVKINLIEQEAQVTAERKARDIVVSTIQRIATDVSSEVTVSTVSLPNDEMKGRIIGREGRNIRAFENATGVDLIIDDTPEAITLSAFDGVRREIARVALERLIADGRIHPARIEEIVEKTKKEMEVHLKSVGEQAAFDVGVQGLHPEIIRLIGRLKYRTSYGQNVLQHSLEVAHIASVLASEIGVDGKFARRAGFIHDIGKSIDRDVEGTHAQIGADLARKHNESSKMVNAIAAHHEDCQPQSIEAVLLQAADAVSASRPGSRRESLEYYLKRLEKLENVANSFRGVEKAYAIQAGREVRIIVEPEEVEDSMVQTLAREIARKIEKEIEYPGQIKVTVVRETRAIDTAK